MLDPRHLKVLSEVARTGSYTAAAEALGYTQPAVSYQMRRLQQDMRTPLVVRMGRGLRLTQAGHALLRHADVIFAALEAAEQEATTLAARGQALVRVAAFQSICTDFVPRVMEILRGTSPGISLVVRQEEPGVARKLLRTGEADIGLLCRWDNEQAPDEESGMKCTELLRDRRCVVMRADHAFAGRETVEFADLAAEAWVLESVRDRFEAACLSNGFTPRIAATVDDHLTIQALVRAGMGISLMSEIAVRAHLPGDLVAVPLHNWPLRISYALHWPDMASVEEVAAVLRSVEATAREMRTSAPS
ncbi:LysR family transcriptional regulator [Streptomyces vinaceus]|uniref:LysR family transcriptional regulator n=1 Tax=Streptomyces vinaceus TaxID=1960 RepID=UPI003807D60C